MRMLRQLLQAKGGYSGGGEVLERGGGVWGQKPTVQNGPTRFSHCKFRFFLIWGLWLHFTSGPGGYITPAAWGVRNTSQWGTESEVDHKWAKWLHNPCRLGSTQHFKAGDKISGGQQVGTLATCMHFR